MLTKEENERLTRVGPGTPMGELLRRFWQPVALADELPEGSAPQPVRLLGEDLVLFRDDRGRVGLLGLSCSHRLVDLSYGRIEDGGLRCIYHGWLYDVHGHCLEQPAEPPGSQFHLTVRHPAYPCREIGGAIWAYLGPGEPPEFPMYEPFTVLAERRMMRKVFADCNWLQSVEGGIDPSHIQFLHRMFSQPQDAKGSGYDVPATGDPGLEGISPLLEVERTGNGLRALALRPYRGREFLRVTQYLVPNTILVAGNPRSGGGYNMGWHVPLDDTHTCRFSLEFACNGPVNRGGADQTRFQEIGPNYRTIRGPENRYLQDRDEMKTRTFAGLGTVITVHDVTACELEGPILDRTRERLGYTDRTVIACRESLIAALDAMDDGEEPAHVLRAGKAVQPALPVPFSELVPEGEEWRPYCDRRIREEEERASRFVSSSVPS
jgi:phenylpropionate dioxygenase-like ring-hydroxylating dioxygenase large terminal subunit